MMCRLTAIVLLCGEAWSKSCETAPPKVNVTAKFWFLEDYDTQGAASVESAVKSYVGAMNEALANSKIPITYHQWGTVEKLPRWSRDFENAQFPNTAFANTFCGTSPCTLAARRRMHQSADAAVLLTNKLRGILGKCAVFYPVDDVAVDRAIPTMVVAYNSPETFVHEAGHCLGATHEGGTCLPGKQFATIMTYTHNCPRHTDQNPVSSILYFSNPDVQLNGVPTGDAQHNNAATIIEAKEYYASVGNNCVDGNDSGQWDSKGTLKSNCRWAHEPKWSNWHPCCCRPPCHREDPNIPWDMRLALDSGHQYRALLNTCVNPFGETVRHDSWMACEGFPPRSNITTKNILVVDVEVRQCDCSASGKALPATADSATLCADPIDSANAGSHGKGLGVTPIVFIVIGSILLAAVLLVGVAFLYKWFEDRTAKGGSTAVRANEDLLRESGIQVVPVVPDVSQNNARSTVTKQSTDLRASQNMARRESRKAASSTMAPARPSTSKARVSRK